MIRLGTDERCEVATGVFRWPRPECALDCPLKRAEPALGFSSEFWSGGRFASSLADGMDDTVMRGLPAFDETAADPSMQVLLLGAAGWATTVSPEPDAASAHN